MHEIYNPQESAEVENLRAAVSEAVRARSLRQVAAEAGLVASTVQHFESGRIETPRPATLEKLRAWRQRSQTMSPADAQVITDAEDAILRTVEPVLRRAVRDELTRVLLRLGHTVADAAQQSPTPSSAAVAEMLASVKASLANEREPGQAPAPAAPQKRA